MECETLLVLLSKGGRGGRRLLVKCLVVIGIVGGIIGALLTSSSLAWAQKPVSLSIAAGGKGGIYYPLGTGMAQLLSRYIPGTEATAEVTGASGDNCRWVGQGRANLAFTVADTAWEAFQGKGRGFKEKVSLRTIAVVYPVFMHLVTMESKGIGHVTDLKGRRVSTGAPKGWTETTSMRILEAFQLNPGRDVKREQWGPVESASALRENKVDAYFWGGGLPTSSLTDFALTPGLRIKLIAHGDAVPVLREKYGPVYVRGTIPARTYLTQEVDVQVPVAWNLLVCHETMKEDLVYQIVKIIIEHQPELVTVQREARFLTLEAQAVGGSPIPYHPGALRYFTEKGLKME